MSTDIASLGIKVESDGVVTADTRLKDLSNSAGKAEKSTDLLAGATKKLAEMYAGLKIVKAIEETVLLAARYETLGVVMATVGKTAGYSASAMEEFSKGLQKNGIAMVESRTGIIKMAQANIDLTKSAELARIAQNAAVIANTNSSEAFDRMMVGLSTGQAIILHHLGLMVNFEAAYKKEAEALGKSKEELTETEKAHARMNETIRASIGIAGVYESAMGTAGKQLQSMVRLVKDFAVNLGTPFLPEFTEAVKFASTEIEKMNKALSSPEGIYVIKGMKEAMGDVKFLMQEIGAAYDALPAWAIRVGLLGAFIVGPEWMIASAAIALAVSWQVDMTKLALAASEQKISWWDLIFTGHDGRKQTLDDLAAAADLQKRISQQAALQAKDSALMNGNTNGQVIKPNQLADDFDHTPEAVAASEKYRKSLEDTKSAYLPLIEEQQKYKDTMTILNKALKEGDITQTEFSTAVDNAQKSLSANKEVEKAAKDAENLSDQWKNTKRDLEMSVKTAGMDDYSRKLEEIHQRAQDLHIQFGDKSEIDTWEAAAIAVEKEKHEIELGTKALKDRNEVDQLAKQIQADAITAEKERYTASKQIYKDLEKAGGEYANKSLEYQIKDLEEGRKLNIAKGVDQDLANADMLAKQKVLYDKWALMNGTFVDGFIVGIHQMADAIPTIGEMGLKTFQRLSTGWSDMFYDVVMGDFTKLGSDWSSMLQDMEKMFIKWIADMVFQWATSEIMKGLVIPIAAKLFDKDSDIVKSLQGFMGGPKAASGAPIVHVENMEGGIGGSGGSTTGLGSGSTSDILGAVSSLSGLFEAGSGWDTVATDMGENMAEAVSTNVDFTGAAVEAFGTTSSAWETAGDNISEAFNSGVDDYFSGTDFTKTYGEALNGAFEESGVWGKGTLNSIQGRDMLSGGTVKTPDTQTLMQQAKPYIQAASAAMAAYGAYNQYKQGNYVGAGVSAVGAASSGYQAYNSLTGSTMGSTGGALVGGAGVVGGVYGMYTGVKDMLKNGVTLQNGLSTALSAYSTYTSGMAAYAALTGTTYTSALSAAMTQAGTYLSTALTSATTTAATTASTAATTAATSAATTTAAGSSGAAAGSGAAGGSSAGAGIGAGGTAAVAFLAWKAVDMFLVNHDKGIVTQTMATSNGGAWKYGYDYDSHVAPGYGQVAMGSARASSDIIKDNIGVGSAIENFRGGIDVLTNQFNSGSAEIYRALESGSISFGQYAASVGKVSVSAQQASEMQNLSSQAAGGSTDALRLLQSTLQGAGIESFAAADAAAAMTSAAEAQRSGYRTSTAGLAALNTTAAAYVDRIALTKISLSQSIPMYDNARRAMEGDKAGISSLTAQLQSIGMGSVKAAAEADKMISAVSMGAKGFNIMASGVMEGYGSLGKFTSGMQTAADDYAYAAQTIGANAAGMQYPIGQMVNAMKGMYGGITGLKGGLDGITGAAIKINNPINNLTNNLTNFSGVALSFADRLQLATQAAYAMPGAVAPHSLGGSVGYAGGGVLEGGSGVADDIFLGTVNGRAQMAMGGEYIMPPEQTKKHLSLLKAMNADKFSVGGMIAGVIAGNGARYVAPPTLTSQLPMVDAALSELGKLLRPIHDMAAGLSDYAISIEGVKEKYADAYAQAKKLKASEAQLIEIRQAQSIELSMEATKHSLEVGNMLSPYQQLNSHMNESQIWLAELSVKYRDAIKAGKELGLSEDQLNIIRNAQNVEILNKRTEALQSAKDIVAKNAMGEDAWAIKQVNDDYDKQRISLQALHATATELNTVEEARNITLLEAKKAALNENDYATKGDYTKAMYGISLPSFAVGTDYVPRDMIAQIHKGERITPARFNQRSDESNAQLLEEIRLLRMENKALGEANAKNTAQANKFFARFDDGDALTVRLAV